jgi:TolB protein
VRLPVRESGWLLLRARTDRAVSPVLDLYPYATTSPVYVSVAGRPARSTEDAAYFLRWIARIEAMVRESRDWNTDAERAGTLERIDQARRQFEQRRAEAAALDAGR